MSPESREESATESEWSMAQYPYSTHPNYTAYIGKVEIASGSQSELRSKVYARIGLKLVDWSL